MTPTEPSAREKATQLLREGLYNESIEFLEEALRENPKDPEIHLYLGYAYAKLDQLDKSIEVLEKAVDVAPTSPKVHYNLGVAYHKANNLTGAKEEYLRALGLDPTYSLARQALEGLDQQTGGTTPAK